MLQDIAVLTGGQVISEEVGLSLEKTTLEDLGSAKKFKSRKKTQPLLMELELLMTSRHVSVKSMLKLKTLLQTMIGRNFKKGWLNSQAVLQLSKLVLPLRLR